MSAIPAEVVLEPAAAGTRRKPRSRPAWPVLVGGAIVAVLAVAAVLAPLIAPYGPNDLDFLHPLSPPSLHHLFGTDDTGRDVFSRSLYGLRIDLLVVVAVTYIPLPIGVVIGAVAGYYGGAIDILLSRLTDIMVAFPFIILVIAVVAIVGPGLTGIVIGIPIIAWALYARLARSEMLVLREQPFMLATTSLGYTKRRAIFRHAVPNLLRTCLVYSTVDMVVNLLVLASMAYLGFGVQPPQAELGTIIADGQSSLLTAWWITTMPGLVLVVFGVAVGLIGDGLSDRKAGR
jgi:peptide/nickel transport system permease protein